MIGWILSEKKQSEIQSLDYSIVRLLEAAHTRDMQLHIYNPTQCDLIVSENENKTILLDGKPTQVPDFVIPRMGSLTGYFALALIRHFESLNVFVLNGSTSIATAKDKLQVHQLLASSNVPTPKTMLVKFPVNAPLIAQEIGFPLVIKNISGMKGAGITLCHSEDMFVDLMELIYYNNNKATIIVQKFIKESFGKDLRVFVIGGRVVACMQRTAQTGFKANYSRGGSATKFDPTPEIESLALQTVRLLGLDVSGVDLLFDTDGFKVCEANSAPGFEGIESVHGKVIAEQILDYIAVRLGKFQRN